MVICQRKSFPFSLVLHIIHRLTWIIWTHSILTPKRLRCLLLLCRLIYSTYNQHRSVPIRVNVRSTPIFRFSLYWSKPICSERSSRRKSESTSSTIWRRSCIQRIRFSSRRENYRVTCILLWRGPLSWSRAMFAAIPTLFRRCCDVCFLSPTGTLDLSLARRISSTRTDMSITVWAATMYLYFFSLTSR